STSLISSPSRKFEKNPMEIQCFLPKVLARNLLFHSTTLKTGDSLQTTKLIWSQKQVFFYTDERPSWRDIENLGPKLILVDFGSAGEEYRFPNEVLDETRNG